MKILFVIDSLYTSNNGTYWLDHPEERKRMEQRYADSGEKYSLSRSVTLFEQMLYKAIEDTRRTQPQAQKQRLQPVRRKHKATA